MLYCVSARLIFVLCECCRNKVQIVYYVVLSVYGLRIADFGGLQLYNGDTGAELSCCIQYYSVITTTP